MKKPTLILCILLLVVQAFPISGGMKKAHAAMTGSGTIAAPYIVMTPDDLSAIRNDLAAHYKLGTNIDLAGYDAGGSGTGWLPIGYKDDLTSKAFTGKLDGNGYTISNMKIYLPTVTFVGLFWKIDESAQLTNVRLRDVQIVGNSTVGAIVGNVLNGEIKNSYATGMVHATGQALFPNNVSVNAGGLVGVNANGTIQNSYAVVDVSGGVRIGGLVGMNSGTILNCYAAGSVNGDNEIGGLVGYNYDPPSPSIREGKIENSYVAGNVKGNFSVGGLVGRNDSGSAANSFWNTDTTGQGASALGIGKASEDMKDPATFVGWNTTTTVWGFVDGATYPYLRAFGMGIGVDKLAESTYSLHPGQDAVSVTGSVYHEAAGEAVSVRYIIRNDAGATVTDATYATPTDSALRPINRKFPLVGFANGDYTFAITATDSRLTTVGTTLAFTVDSTAVAPPAVHFAMNGSEAWANSASTVVTVTDSGGGVDAAEMKYSWSTDDATPGPGANWALFASGDTLSKSGVDGDWYLHIRAQDQSAPAPFKANVTSNRFRLDTSTAVLSGMTLSAGTLNSAFTGSTYAYTASVTNATSTLTVTPVALAATDTIAVSVNGGAPQAVASHAASAPLALKVGDNTVEVTVTALNGSQHTYTVTVIRAGSGSTPGAPDTKPVIDLNGSMLDPGTIDIAKPSVTLEVEPRNGTAYASIPAGILAEIASKNSAFLIEIRTPYGSYQVPVNLASLIPELAQWLATHNLKADEISFKITLTDKSGDKGIQAAFAGGLPNGSVRGAIVDFRLDVIDTRTGNPIGTADKFSQALARIIPMPKNMTSMPEQWGAFRYNETTKQFEFVPARKVQIDGIWYVTIHSNSNSVYVVADNPVRFTDMQKHWGQSYVDLAAAKGLVHGVGGGRYDPDKAVTRAEFIAMLVRALGRSTSAGSTAPYSDVKPGAWYFGEVAAAKELGLLDFVKGNRFNPNKPLTREEMASILAAAVSLEQLPATEEEVSLDGYKDIGSVDAAYLEDVRFMVELHIMKGTSADTFSPKDTTTRAQAAVVFIRTLQTLGKID